MKSTEALEPTLRAVNDVNVFEVTGLPPTYEPVTGEYRTTRVPPSMLNSLFLNSESSDVEAVLLFITAVNTACSLHAPPAPVAYGLVFTTTEP